VDLEQVEKSILEIDEVQGVHDLHTWSIDGEYNVLTIHVVLKTTQPMEELRRLKILIRETLLAQGVQHCTIEFEVPDEKCDMEISC